jgi:hypothetical protein
MSGTATVEPRPRRGSSLPDWLLGVGLVALPLVGLLATLISTSHDHTTMSGRTSMHRLEFGRPLDWLQQDQSSASPPAGARIGLGSPYDDPTHVHVIPFLVDVALWTAAAALVAVPLVAGVRSFAARADDRS